MLLDMVQINHHQQQQSHHQSQQKRGGGRKKYTLYHFWQHSSLLILFITLGSIWWFDIMSSFSFTTTTVKSGQDDDGNISTMNNNRHAFSTTTSKSKIQSIEYQQIEQGQGNKSFTRSGSSFVRYIAIDKTTNNPITVLQWAELMSGPNSNHFSNPLTKIIQTSSYKGVFFETKGVTSTNASTKIFEFVLINAPELASFAEQEPDSYTFAEYFNKQQCINQKYCCQFTNLGGDATLIAPRQVSEKSTKVFSHLKAFINDANEEQIVDIWKVTAQTYLNMLQTRSKTKPIWFSTSGMGIAWLHFRLDDRPKYYQYKPFANEK